MRRGWPSPSRATSRPRRSCCCTASPSAGRCSTGWCRCSRRPCGLVAIDLPGFGARRRCPGGGFDLGVVCERVEAAIAELGLERPALLGHSLGGGVAVRYAAERPGALRALTLIAPAGPDRDRRGAALVAPPAAARARPQALLRAAIPVIAASRGLRERAFARVVGDPSALDAALARELLMGAAQGRSTPAAGIEIVYAGLRDRLDALTLPALVVWGGRDHVVSPRYAEPLRDALPDGRLLLLPAGRARADVRGARRGRDGGAGVLAATLSVRGRASDAVRGVARTSLIPVAHCAWLEVATSFACGAIWMPRRRRSRTRRSSRPAARSVDLEGVPLVQQLRRRFSTRIVMKQPF